MKKALLFITLILIGENLFSQNWQPVMNGCNHIVRKMLADTTNNYLYVSGRFNSIGDIQAKGIARWNGVSWDSLAKGLDGLDTGSGGVGSMALGMALYNNKLYVSGDFKSLGTNYASQMGTWDGNQWDSLSIQPNTDWPFTSIDNLVVINNELYVSGQFDSIGGISANSIAKWDGTNWFSLSFPNYFPSAIHQYSSIVSICEYHGKIYVAGSIRSSPLDTVGDILSFNGVNWLSVNGGIKGNFIRGISSMVVYKNELYIGGAFLKADGNAGNHIQKWNDTIWSDAGDGMGINNPFIWDLKVYNNKLYAGGVFDFAGGVLAHKIACWNGQNWCGLGGNFDNNIDQIEIFHDSIFIGGGFATIDSDTMNNIAKWNGGNYLDTCSSFVSIEEHILSPELKLFPNPTTNIVSIKSEYIIDKIFIDNIFGDRIYSKNNNSLNFQIDLSKMPNGIYFIQMEIKSKKYIRKILKY